VPNAQGLSDDFKREILFLAEKDAAGLSKND
jgi:hypothetical protein